MRLVTAVLAAVLAFGAVAQPVVESVEVHVVEIEAVVLDKAGKPVEGLTRDDFEVTIDGQRAEVTNFFTVRRGAVLDDGIAEGGIDTPGVKFLPSTRVPSRLLIVIDDLHLRPTGKGRALTALRRFVETSMEESTTAMIIRWNGTMTVRVKPTNDRATLLRELAEMEREPAMAIRAQVERTRIMRKVDEAILEGNDGGRIEEFNTENMAKFALRDIDQYSQELQREVENTISALSDLIAMATGLEGRKVVLYVSEGLPMQPGADLRDYAIKVFSRHPLNPEGTTRIEDLPGGRSIDSARYDVLPSFRALTKRAQDSGVVFSALDPGGVRGFEGSGPENASSLATLDTMLVRSNASEGMRMVAAESGGRFLENENDLDRAVSILTQDVATYYSLGVKPPSKKAIDVQVHVRGRKDLRVITPRRRGLMSREEAVSSSIRARLYSREQSNPLGARVFLGSAWPDGRRCVAPVQIVVPADELTTIPSGGTSQGELAIYAVALDDRQQESNIRTVKRPISLRPGESLTESIVFGFQPRRYLISVAIVDTLSGQTSYLLTDVDAKVCGR